MVKFVVGMMLVGSLAFVGQQETAQQEENKFEGVKCIFMAKKDVNAEQFVETEAGKVYVCCGGCKSKLAEALEEDKNAFATKINHQMVATGQYVQKACPFSGGDVNEEHMVKVGGVEVKFCCGGCAGKVSGEEDLAKQAEMVFNAETFKKGFAKKSAEEGDGE